MIVSLKMVTLDDQANNGTWCRLPYPSHPRGCPNYGRKAGCPPDAPRFSDVVTLPFWLVAQPFDLQAQEDRMMQHNPAWSVRQARCCLYWQRGLVEKLREEAENFVYYLNSGLVHRYTIIENPEGAGVDLFDTCKDVGIHLERDYRRQRTVWKMMIVGRTREGGCKYFNDVECAPCDECGTLAGRRCSHCDCDHYKAETREDAT